MTNTARVADGYGVEPNEHKPSQDPFLPDVDKNIAEAKQEVSAGAEVDDETVEKANKPYPTEADKAQEGDVEGGEDVSPGSSSSTSTSDNESSTEKTGSKSQKHVLKTESPSVQDPTAGPTARSTGGDQSKDKGKADR